MKFRSLPVSVLSIGLILFAFNQTGLPQSSPRLLHKEVFPIRALIQISNAQATYVVTSGSSGTLAQLFAAGLIDQALASGSKYGYLFQVTLTPEGYFATATPRQYRRTGVRSFYIDTTGELRGGDKAGQIADGQDPYVDSCAFWGVRDNERCTRIALRSLNTAEATFASTVGSGNYGNLSQLLKAGLLRPSLSNGELHGYRYSITTVPRTGSDPASFKITAVPITYGVTGVVSYFIDESGVLRGADRSGGPADQDDPPVNNRSIRTRVTRVSTDKLSTDRRLRRSVLPLRSRSGGCV